MKRSLACIALVLTCGLSPKVSSADVICGYYCAHTTRPPRENYCVPGGRPTEGCVLIGELGAACMSMSTPSCGGGAGCGYDGTICPWEPIP